MYTFYNLNTSKVNNFATDSLSNMFGANIGKPKHSEKYEKYYSNI